MSIFKKERLAAIEKRADVTRSHGILIVDDEEANIQTLAFLLKDHYEVFSARDGQEAFEKMSDPEFARKVQLIICDQRMPKLTGVQFFQRVIDLAPDTIRILLTGYTDIQSIIESINQAHIYKFMLKPVDHQDLLMTLRRALETYDLRKKLEEYHRGLEDMVRRRTQQLEEANLELRRNHENLIRTQDQLVMREKMAFLGTMTAGIAHELKNPLNFIINFAKNVDETAREIVSEQAPALSALPVRDGESVLDLMQEVSDGSERICFHGQRANEVITLMTKLSRENAAPKEPADLNEVLSRYIDLAYQSAGPRMPELELKIEKDFDPGLSAVVLSNLGIGRVVTSLMNNSLESVALKLRRLGASFVPCIRVRTRALPNQVELRFWDNGVGIPSQVLPQVFHPFFTTKADSKNIGLGLAIAYDIVVQEHGGQLEVHAEENEYAEFVVRLPST
jgi:signal transduction histidine kinase